MEVVDDPTHSGRGKVVKGTIVGDAVMQAGGYSAFRAHTGFTLPNPYAFPCRLTEDIWMSKDFRADIISGQSWYSQLSLFTPVDNGEYGISVTSMMIKESSWTGYGLGIEGYMTLDLQDPAKDKHVQKFTKIMPGAPRFTPEKWHQMAIEVDRRGWAYLYQDGILVTKGELISQSKEKLTMVHGGPIYGGDSFKRGSYVLVDNFSITCWP